MIDDPTNPLYLPPEQRAADSGREGGGTPRRLTLDEALMFDAFEEPLMLNRAYVDIGGSITAGLWLSYAEQLRREREEEDAPGNEGWFTLSREEWYRRTGLSYREQETARKRLRDMGVLKERRRGMPAVLEHRIVQEAMRLLLKERTRLVWGDRLVEDDRP